MEVLAIHSVLAATDLDEGSDEIVRTAAEIAARSGAQLHLLHALELQLPPYVEARPGGSLEDRAHAVEEAIEKQFRRVAPATVELGSCVAVIYVPYRAVLDRATDVAADLIVLGPHRGGAIETYLLGTTADRVIRSAEAPCLVVRDTLRLPLRRIGVPMDFSDPARSALALAIGLSRALGGEGADAPEIQLIHVGSPDDRADDPDLEERKLRPELERQIESAAASATGAPAPRIEAEVVWHDEPRRAVVEWIAGRQIDLVVVGTHGQGGMKRALIGSMASALARQTPCPVLLVPPTLRTGPDEPEPGA